MEFLKRNGSYVVNRMEVMERKSAKRCQKYFHILNPQTLWLRF